MNSKLNYSNKTVGAMFGSFRGILLISIVIYLLSISPTNTVGWWNNSKIKVYFISKNYTHFYNNIITNYM